MSCTAVITTRETQMRERRVCVFVSQWWCFYSCLKVCTICNKQRWDSNINIRIVKRKAFYCSTVPWFWGSTYSNSLQYMWNRTKRIYETIFVTSSNVLQPCFWPLGKRLAATNTVRENVTGNTVRKRTIKHMTPSLPAPGLHNHHPSPHKSPEEK